ncbi:hypothetical protein HYU18_01180 [Candidatus Woesearchaeota archaeon]|nr:hypothetical protein [Candidatus Woesearchaeota archaeon]
MDVKVENLDINKNIGAYGNGRHTFNEEFLRSLSKTDIFIVSTSMIDRTTMRDGHLPWLDAIIQSVSARTEARPYKPVILAETPMTVDPATTEAIVNAAIRNGIGIHENLIELLDPVKPLVAQEMKELNLVPEHLVIERSDNQIHLENPGAVNRALIAVRAVPTWEKGIPHDLLPPKRMLEDIVGEEIQFQNFSVVNATPYRGKDGTLLKYADGTGAEHFCATDVTVRYEAVTARGKAIPVTATWSFNRPPARRLEFNMPGRDIVFYSSLPKEQFSGELPQALKSSQGNVTGYFATLRDGVTRLMAAAATANPLRDFIKAGIDESLGRGIGLVDPHYSIWVAQMGQQITRALDNYISGLEMRQAYHTEWWAVRRDTTPLVTVIGRTKGIQN